MALLACAIAADALSDAFHVHAELVATGLASLSIVCAGASWTRWARAERALRHGRPLPALTAGPVVPVGLMALTIVAMTRMS